MAYNSNKGKQHSGDIQYENDANDTQIDFENDSITLRTGNQPRLEVNNGHVSASGPMSASAFFGDGSNLTGIGGGGSMSSFILSGSTGPTQTISDGNTLNISGGVGITTTAGATDKLTIDLDNTDVSAGSYTYTSLTVDAQGRVTAASNGSAPSVTTFNGYAENRVLTAGETEGEIDGEANLTFNGSLLQVSGTVSASAAISASTFYGDGSNLTGIGGGGGGISWDGSTANGIATYKDADEATVESNLTFDGTMLQVSGTVSASAAISASSFFGDGSNLTGVGGGGSMSTFIVSGNAGTEQTISDGNTLFISGGTGITSVGAATDQLNISLDNTDVSAGSYVFSSITVDAQGRLTAASSGTPAVTNYNSYAENRLITAGASSGHIDGEPNLTFNGTMLQVSGTVSASAAISASSFYGAGAFVSSINTPATVISADHISSSLPISGSSFFGNGSNLTGLPSAAITTYNNSGANKIITSVNSNTVQGEDDLIYNSIASKLSVTGQVSASLGVTGSSLRTADTVIDFQHISSSLPISGSSFFGDGSNLTGIAGGGISFNGSGVDSLVTYADANTADVQANLTFSPGTSKLGVIGQISASLGVTGSSIRTADTVIDFQHISSSLPISGSSFFGDGSNLTGIAGGGIPDVVSDTSPQLGGNLDVNGNDIVSVSNGNIELDPNGSGKVVFKGNGTKGSGQFVLNCENNSHGIIIKGPPHSAGASYTLTLPNNDGDADQVLKTDGAGNTSWVDRVSFNGSTVDGLVTYANANTADVQANLTFSPGTSKLGVAGQVSASLGITGSEVHTNNAVVAGHIFYPSVTSLGNNTGTGEIVRFGTGTTTAGKTYYLSTGGAWSEVNSAASGSSGLPLVAVAIGTSPTAQGMMIRGFFDFATYLTGAFSPGMPVYLTGSGGVTTIRPSNPGESLRVAGHCTTTANVIYFNPSPDYLSLT